MNPCFGGPDRDWLHPERFCNQPIYCEALHNPDDVICPGSDDEAYRSPTDRRMRYEAQAQRFLEGKPIFLLSASLRGPFDRKSGWINPWRSKSASRTKSVRRRRPPASRRATVEQNESSNAPDSSPYNLPTPENKSVLPCNTNTSPRYMDDESFSRVWDWRDRVLAELQDHASPSQSVSQAEQASLDSRLATQHSVAQVASFDGGSKSSPEPLSPGVVGCTATQGIPRISRREVRESSPCPQDRAGRVACSSQALVSASCLNSSGPPAMAEDFNALNVADLSPHAEKIYGQSVMSERATSTDKEPLGAQCASTESVPAKEAPLVRPPAKRENAEVVETSTPRETLPEATASFVHAKAQASPRADGSFRYRRNDRRDIPKPSRPGSKLFDSLYPALDADRYPTPSDRPTSNPSEDKEIRGTCQERKISDGVLADAVEGLQEVVTAATEVEGRGTPEDLPKDTPEIMPCQPMEEPDGCVAGPGQRAGDEEDGDGDGEGEAASQIDGPTLVPSRSSSGPGHPSISSFGHFSAEKQSQDIISEPAALPRRLLWPKSRRSANNDSALMLALEPEPTPNSTQPEPVELGHGCSVGEGVFDHVDISKAVQAPPKGQALASIQQEQPSIVSENIGEHAESMAENAKESEREDERMLGQGELQAGIVTESDSRNGAGPETQPAAPSPGPGIQSPWANGNAAPLPHRVPDLNKSGGGEIPGDTDTRAAQSPWTNQANAVPHTPPITEQLRPPQIGNLDLSFIASQTLELAASQSPWARGDSQITAREVTAREVTVFNPLSSPANSVVLPTATHRIAQSQQSAEREEDIDMCNSQLYPPHPSTPETKQSGLPTPDFTFPVRSFRDFMTPSPQRPAKKRRLSTDAASHLPSTQALINAAISNPWAKPFASKPRRQKRVSWAPLPDEAEPGTPEVNISITAANSPCSAELSTSSTNVIRTRTLTQTLRAGSPPPSILATSRLPTDANQKFAKHFAAVANRRWHGSGGGVAVRKTPGLQKGRLLPSESQQVCPSPAVDAMAEAFLQADAHHPNEGRRASCSSPSSALRAGDEGEAGVTAVQVQAFTGMEIMENGSGNGDDDDDDDKENRERGPMLSLPAEEAEASQLIDDVSAVMENLDDYLGGGAWDLDAELAKANASERRREAECRESGFGRLSGLMDTGVWN
ncbi:hypothetical protein MMYC01_201216 [Madurella mycetomatis]|uniref:Protamine P1 n=1 Tax=Madurella mycetomatis TaxID=100816 RepID=A0A175WFJ9_9PEZI|nr:hypothetical protein MMYC01_201216 [Madurella mycetomatis]